MPAERVSMRKIREVLRLTHALGISRRLVGEAQNASYNRGMGPKNSSPAPP